MLIYLLFDFFVWKRGGGALLVKILCMICFILTSAGTLSLINNVKIKENLTTYQAEMMIDVVEERIINYYCNNAVLPDSLSPEFISDSGFKLEDIADITYVREPGGKSFTLSVVRPDGVKFSRNSRKVLPDIPGYVDKTLVGVSRN